MFVESYKKLTFESCKYFCPQFVPDHTGGVQWLIENLEDEKNPIEIYAHRLLEKELLTYRESF